MIRRRDRFVAMYGPVAGPKLYHALQSQAAHAGVSARLRRKLDAMEGRTSRAPRQRQDEWLPLFPGSEAETAAARTEP